MTLITAATPSPIFRPPPGCLDRPSHVPPGGDPLGYSAYIQYESQPMSSGTSTWTSTYTALMGAFDSSCFPPGFSFTAYTTNSYSDTTFTVWTMPIYYPATCPSGYSMVVASYIATTETYATCCPTLVGGQKITPPRWGPISLGNLECTYNVLETDWSMPLVTSQTTTSLSMDMVYLTPVVVRHFASHLSYWATPTRTPTTSVTPAPAVSPSTETASPPNRTPSADRLSIGAGVAAGAVVLLALLIWVLWRRRRRSQARRQIVEEPKEQNLDLREYRKAELPGESNFKAELEAKSREDALYELPSPAEVTGPSELDGDWRGSEAAALIEVDLSRPEPGKESAKAEAIDETH